jgi:alkylated DNA repair dioxygenase AlkB
MAIADPVKITAPFLDISYYPHFLNAKEAVELFEHLHKTVPWPHAHMTKKGVLSKKRNKYLCGDPDVRFYTATFRGKVLHSPVDPWSKVPILETLRDRVRALTGQDYHVCSLQLYNNGEVKIDPHRDKEMEAGTIIASISLGETRVMRFDRSGCTPAEIPLKAGSLCLMNPPTNDKWLHSIPADGTRGKRLSIIFRNYLERRCV